MLLANASYSQTSDPSTLTGNDRAELVTRCEQAAKEVKASRVVIDAQTKLLAEKEKALEESLLLNELSDEQIAVQQAEIAHLRDAIGQWRIALVEKEAALQEYKKALGKVTKRKNFFKSIAKFTTVAAVVAIGIVVLK